MKYIFHTTRLLFFSAVIFLSSCSKPTVINNNSGNIQPPPPLLPYPTPDVSKNIFYANAWHATVTGYEIDLTNQWLTQDQINRGIDVKVAITGADESPWFIVPGSFYNSLLIPDTIYVTYNMAPGHLHIIARASFDLSMYRSDINIEYR